MRATQLINQFQQARKDIDLAVVEGVQALKHAIRFEAEIDKIITSDVNAVEALLDGLAPDVKRDVLSQAEEVSEETFAKLSPQPPRTRVIALAKRKSYTLSDIHKSKPVVLLEDPRDLENIGAVIRVSAAADVAAVCVTGSANIWHPAVIRGAAGLHYALPVLNVKLDEIIALKRPLISLDPTGREAKSVVKNPIFIFGTERHGISQELLDKSDEIIRLPMKPGVSSLNLATSVAATLYRS